MCAHLSRYYKRLRLTMELKIFCRFCFWIGISIKLWLQRWIPNVSTPSPLLQGKQTFVYPKMQIFVLGWKSHSYSKISNFSNFRQKSDSCCNGNGIVDQTCTNITLHQNVFTYDLKKPSSNFTSFVASGLTHVVPRTMYAKCVYNIPVRMFCYSMRNSLPSTSKMVGNFNPWLTDTVYTKRVYTVPFPKREADFRVTSHSCVTFWLLGSKISNLSSLRLKSFSCCNGKTAYWMCIHLSYYCARSRFSSTLKKFANFNFTHKILLMLYRAQFILHRPCYCMGIEIHLTSKVANFQFTQVLTGRLYTECAYTILDTAREGDISSTSKKLRIFNFLLLVFLRL